MKPGAAVWRRPSSRDPVGEWAPFCREQLAQSAGHESYGEDAPGTGAIVRGLGELLSALHTAHHTGVLAVQDCRARAERHIHAACLSQANALGPDSSAEPEPARHAFSAC